MKRQFGKDMPDVFYTKPEVVRSCVSLLKEECSKRGIVIESVVDFAAGDGEFARVMGCPQFKNYDLIPRSEDVEQRNWFSVPASGPPPTVIGFNPPFGYQCTMVKKFLTHAAEFQPTVMCSVHPFVRKNIAPKGYGPVESIRLEKESFYNPENGASFTIPGCMFTIFLRGHECVRAPVDYAKVPGFERVTQETPWDALDIVLCVRRRGVNSGRQIIVKWTTGAMILDHNGAMQPVEVDKLASASFHRFACVRRPNEQFIRRFQVKCSEMVERQLHGITRNFLLENAIEALNYVLETGGPAFD